MVPPQVPPRHTDHQRYPDNLQARLLPSADGRSLRRTHAHVACPLLTASLLRLPCDSTWTNVRARL